MLDIEYKGANAVTIATKNSTLVCDPKLSLVGLKDIKTKDAIVLATEERFVVDGKDARLVIESPGDFEVGDFSIHGIAARRHIDADDARKLATIYRMEVNDVRIAILGNVESKIDDIQLEEIGVIDILILPVGGGGYTLDATSASSIVRQTEPKVVIPVHYADKGVSYEVPQDTLETFTKELGAPVESLERYRIKSVSALPETLTIVGLSRS